jgi:hypothetical protein
MEKPEQDATAPMPEGALERLSDESESPTTGFFARANDKISSIRYLEARGIERVPESERHKVGASNYIQMTLLWFSTNITANNIAVGMLVPATRLQSWLHGCRAVCRVRGGARRPWGGVHEYLWPGQRKPHYGTEFAVIDSRLC